MMSSRHDPAGASSSAQVVGGQGGPRMLRSVMDGAVRNFRVVVGCAAICVALILLYQGQWLATVAFAFGGVTVVAGLVTMIQSRKPQHGGGGEEPN